MKPSKEKFNLDDLLTNIDWNSNKLVKVNSNIVLTQYQTEILKSKKIPYESAGSLSNLIYLIDDALNEIEDEELEAILAEISERNYYENTHK